MAFSSWQSSAPSAHAVSCAGTSPHKAWSGWAVVGPHPAFSSAGTALCRAGWTHSHHSHHQTHQTLATPFPSAHYGRGSRCGCWMILAGSSVFPSWTWLLPWLHLRQAGGGGGGGKPAASDIVSPSSYPVSGACVFLSVVLSPSHSPC